MTPTRNNSNVIVKTRVSSANSRLPLNINKDIATNINNKNLNKNVQVKNYSNNYNAAIESNQNILKKGQQYEYKSPYKVNNNIDHGMIHRPSSSRDKVQNTRGQNLMYVDSKRKLVPDIGLNQDQKGFAQPIKITEINTNKRILSGVPSNRNIRVNQNNNEIYNHNNFLKGAKAPINDYQRDSIGINKIANNGPKLLNIYRK